MIWNYRDFLEQFFIMLTECWPPFKGFPAVLAWEVWTVFGYSMCSQSWCSCKCFVASATFQCCLAFVLILMAWFWRTICKWFVAFGAYKWLVSVMLEVDMCFKLRLSAELLHANCASNALGVIVFLLKVLAHNDHVSSPLCPFRWFSNSCFSLNAFVFSVHSYFRRPECFTICLFKLNLKTVSNL